MVQFSRHVPLLCLLQQRTYILTPYHHFLSGNTPLLLEPYLPVKVQVPTPTISALQLLWHEFLGIHMTLPALSVNYIGWSPWVSTLSQIWGQGLCYNFLFSIYHGSSMAKRFRNKIWLHYSHWKQMWNLCKHPSHEWGVWFHLWPVRPLEDWESLVVKGDHTKKRQANPEAQEWVLNAHILWSPSFLPFNPFGHSPVSHLDSLLYGRWRL